MGRHVYATNYDGGLVWVVGVFMGSGGTTSGQILLMEVFYQGVSIDVGQGFSAVMCLGKPSPPDKILELIAPPSCTQDLFHFPLRLSVDQVWWQFWKVIPMFLSFPIWREK